MSAGTANILRFLGLAAKAGKVVSGFDQTASSIERGDVRLLLVSEDISANTLDGILTKLSRSEAQIPQTYSIGSSYELGNAIGKPHRAVVGVTDEGFANKLIDMLDKENDNKEEIQ